ncbi:MAG: calcium-binding protein [Pirellulaceae bacterium]
MKLYSRFMVVLSVAIAGLLSTSSASAEWFLFRDRDNDYARIYMGVNVDRTELWVTLNDDEIVIVIAEYVGGMVVDGDDFDLDLADIQKLDLSGSSAVESIWVDPAVSTVIEVLVDTMGGNDVINGGTYAYGGPGDDVIRNSIRAFGRDGDDDMYAGPMTIEMRGGNGNDFISLARATTDVITHGDAGNDMIIGSPLADTINGGPGDDILSGEGGNDDLSGDTGIDWLLGGPGHDYLNPGTYEGTRERVYGQAGNDTFRLRNLNNYYHDFGQSGNDVLDQRLPLRFQVLPTSTTYTIGTLK